jgi:hypothetical protein
MPASGAVVADAAYRGKVALLRGSTWESNSGSNLVAKASGRPHPGFGPPSGGLAPTAPGSPIGEEVKVPYTVRTDSVG